MMKSLLAFICFQLSFGYVVFGQDVAEPWSSTSRGELSFVTRPDIKPQRLNITTYEPDLVSPGYFFFAPFDHRWDAGRHVFVPGQIGPHIYDTKGDLIWSGVHVFEQRNVQCFEVTKYKGRDALAFNVYLEGDVSGPTTQVSSGVILNNTYGVEERVLATNGTRKIDMHEFRLVEDGRHALVIVHSQANTSQLTSNGTMYDGKVVNNEFEEVDIATNETLFSWSALDHVPLAQSQQFWLGEGRADPYHMNSVEKTSDGNYLVSIRHMSAVYLISGYDGSIIWQVGGQQTSFVHVDNFTFSFQHHARIYSRNSTHTIISFMDNSSSETVTNGECSSALLLSLNTETMTAAVLRRWLRPDGEHTWQRGSVQMLPNDNSYASWSLFGYSSEFTWDGQLVQEVRFAENRFVDYRSFKFEFEGFSNEPIAVVSRVQGASADSILTSVYVSWNGATTVAKWNLYGKKKCNDIFTQHNETNTQIGTADTDGYQLLGSEVRTGFETLLMVPGYHQDIFVEAVDAGGKSLGNSSLQTTTPPPDMSYQQQQRLIAWIKQGHEGRINWVTLAAWIVGALGIVAGITGVYVAVLYSRPGYEARKGWSLVSNPKDSKSLGDMEESCESLLSASDVEKIASREESTS